uniref:Uncharacterized protein LOC109505212 n=1 Tax=Elaeis guineensis var. tenera TaxID=51953 RepID=A0A6J0PDP0_ELAGV|nr:uncharacterized protein LOC109505212 [Elaeis guineensis]
MIVMRGRKMKNSLYKMEGSVVTEEFDAAAAAQDQQETHWLWHYHLGHMGDRKMKELNKHGLISNLDGSILKICEPYQMKKERRVQFASSSARSEAPLELVHIDVWGPAPISGTSGGLDIQMEHSPKISP